VNLQLQGPGNRIVHQSVAFGIVLFSGMPTLAHCCFEGVIGAVVKTQDVRRQPLLSRRLGIVDKTLVRCPRQADEQEPVPSSSQQIAATSVGFLRSSR